MCSTAAQHPEPLSPELKGANFSRRETIQPTIVDSVKIVLFQTAIHSSANARASSPVMMDSTSYGAGHARHQFAGIGRRGVATPSDVLIGPHQGEIAAIEIARLGRRNLKHLQMARGVPALPLLATRYRLACRRGGSA